MATFREQLRQTAINLIGGQPYRRQQERMARLLDRAFRGGPGLVPTQMLLQQLGEVDTRLLDIFLRQQNYQMLTGQYIGKLNLTEQDRLRVVEQSRYYHHFDVQYENAVTMFTDFGFGQQVDIIPEDDAAKEVWDECWTARRNAPLFKQRKLQDMSNDVVIDGEMFFAGWATAVDGKVTWRRYATDEVAEIVYSNEDTDIPLFYRVNTDSGDVYFPDWMATRRTLDKAWETIAQDNKEAKRADELDRELEINGESTSATDVVMLHAAYNRSGGRGWPKFYRGIEWVESLRTHIGDHLTVAKAVATFVDEITTKGGSRGVDQIAAKFASSLTTSSDWLERNPSPAAGSVLTHNEATKVERRPLTTAAGDAQTTAGLVVSQVSASTKVPPHWMGFTQTLQNRATARESGRPFVEQMQRYQEFWADVFQDMVEITLMFAEKYGGQQFDTYDAQITFESPLLIGSDEIAQAITAINDAMVSGAVDPDIGRRALDWLVALSLVSLGARNVQTILHPEDEEPMPDEEPTGVPQTTEVPEPVQPIERVAEIIQANARDGSVDWQTVAEWALDEVVI